MPIVLLVLAGLAIFLFALNGISDNLKELAGEQLRLWLDRFTGSLLTGIISGAVVTTALDSSSAVIIMTIALVSSGAMTFRQAIGVVMGANIGTTIGSQIIAFDIGEWSAIPMLIALPIILTAKNDRSRQSALVLFYTGLLFFGLFTMGEAVQPLKDSPQFLDWMAKLKTPWRGAIAGGVVTVVIQSSSATVGMAIKLCGQGIMEISAGIAVMLGAELGTCANTLIATIGRSRPAVRTGIFHLIFNLFTIIIGLLLIHPFTDLVLYISVDAPVNRQLANAHVLFNVLGVLICIPLVPLYEKVIYFLVPEKP
jgi:phosphate:Na+ symporter